MPLTVGFDLDMTLIDSRRGIAAVLDRLSTETGIGIDSAAAITRIGAPIELELARWFPAAQVSALADRFRALYPGLAMSTTSLLLGASDAIEAVRRHGGRVVVVTGKHGASASAHLVELGLSVDVVVGRTFGAAKGLVLREHGATVYVGDHIADIDGARAAGALAVGVGTGPYDVDALRAYGADVVLADLTGFPGWLDEHVRRVRVADLERRLHGLGTVVVAFSGGADSAFLLAAAARVLGPSRVVAATAVSPSLPETELGAARDFAAALGVVHLAPRTDELGREGYRANGGDRCYFCKAELLDTLGPLAARLQAVVLTGTNADDAVAGFRPGIRAAAERGAHTPLRDAGLTKQQIRDTSRQWGLVTWDKPAAACLSSRIAYGLPITAGRLARVGHAEAALRARLHSAGHRVRDLRVRDLGSAGARVEVDAALVEVLAQDSGLLAAVTGSSAVQVTAFRSGSMNDALVATEQIRVT